MIENFSSSYLVNISMGVAKVTLIQMLTDPFQSHRELELMFAIHSDSAFDSLNIQIGEKSISAEIKEIQEANKEYEKGVKEGKQMVLSEMTDHPDIMITKIGNLGMNEQLKITFTYIQPLELCANSFWRLNIPCTLRPRYDSSLSFYNNQFYWMRKLKRMEIEANENNAENKNIRITFDTRPSFVQSPTHKIEYQEKINQLEGTLNNKQDFVLLFADNNINKLTNIVTHTNEDQQQHQKYCVTIEFTPQVNVLQYQDAYQQYLDDTFDQNFIQDCVYVFILDCSGSMAGSLIDSAKQALILFLKSLPMGSEFNIIKFGTKSYEMYKKLMPMTDENLQQTIQKINEIDATLGGTYIDGPLKKAYDVDSKKKILNIFLLTDGEVQSYNIYKIIQHEKSKRNRLYTIGVGDGCSTDFIVKSARLGQGLYTFINNKEDMAERIINLLQDSMTPYFEKLKLEIDQNENLEQIFPNPAKIDYIRRNKPFIIHLTFNSNQQQPVTVKFRCFDPIIKEEREFSQTIDFQKSSESKVYHKILANKMIKYIEDNLTLNQQKFELIQKKNQNEFKQQDIINLSLTNQVLSQFTAFICDLGQPAHIYKDNIQQEHIFDRFLPGYNGSRGGGSRGGSRGGMICRDSRDAYFDRSEQCKKVQRSDSKSKSRSRDRDKKRQKKSCRSRQRQSPSPKRDEKASISRLERNVKQQEQEQEQLPIFQRIIQLQNAEGSFSIDVINLIVKTKDGLNVPTGLNDQQWSTLLVMVYFQQRYQNQKNEWILIYNKANQYLKSQGVNYSQYKSQAQLWIGE